VPPLLLSSRENPLTFKLLSSVQSVRKETMVDGGRLAR
jgi:hypothetical protein